METLCCKIVGWVALAEAGVITALFWSMWSRGRAHARALDECLALVRTARRAGDAP
jgi:hypothetical protein